MLIAIIILAVLVVLAIAAGFFFASSSMSIRRQTLDEARKWQEDHYDLSWYDPLEKPEYQVTSYDGYVLNAELISNPIPADKYVLLSHGYTDNRFGSLKYTKMYLDLGFNRWARQLIRYSYQIQYCLAELKMLGKYTEIDEEELKAVQRDYGRRPI